MERKGAVTTVTFEEGKKILDTCPGSILLDVRTEDEFETEHALGAKLLPLDEIDADRAAEIIPAKDTKVILYCRSGRRSATAALMLAHLGYWELYDMGGLNGWPYGMDFGLDI